MFGTLNENALEMLLKYMPLTYYANMMSAINVF